MKITREEPAETTIIKRATISRAFIRVFNSKSLYEKFSYKHSHWEDINLFAYDLIAAIFSVFTSKETFNLFLRPARLRAKRTLKLLPLNCLSLKTGRIPSQWSSRDSAKPYSAIIYCFCLLIPPLQPILSRLALCGSVSRKSSSSRLDICDHPGVDMAQMYWLWVRQILWT